MEVRESPGCAMEAVAWTEYGQALASVGKHGQTWASMDKHGWLERSERMLLSSKGVRQSGESSARGRGWIHLPYTIQLRMDKPPGQKVYSHRILRRKQKNVSF